MSLRFILHWWKEFIIGYFYEIYWAKIINYKQVSWMKYETVMYIRFYLSNNYTNSFFLYFNLLFTSSLPTEFDKPVWHHRIIDLFTVTSYIKNILTMKMYLACRNSVTTEGYQYITCIYIFVPFTRLGDVGSRWPNKTATSWLAGQEDKSPRSVSALCTKMEENVKNESHSKIL